MLINNVSLVELNLEGNWICNKGVIALGDALKINRFLQILNLSSNVRINDEGVVYLAKSLVYNKGL